MGSFRVSSTQCCGIKELADISSLPTPEAIVKAAASCLAGPTDYYRNPPAWLMFSGVVGTRKRVYTDYHHANRDDDYGQALADYIRSNDLGVVTETPLAKNYNGNMLRVWMWAPKWEALQKIWFEEASRPAASVGPSLSVDAPIGTSNGILAPQVVPFSDIGRR